MGAADREIGRAVTDHGLAGQVLEDGLGAANVGAELGRRLARDELVSVAVRGDLVLLCCNFPNETGMTGRHLSKDEEGRPGVGRGQKGEHSIGARLDTTLETSDRAMRAFLKDSGVEILLNVHAEHIHDGGSRFHQEL